MVLSICINALGSEVHSSGMRLVRLLDSVGKNKILATYLKRGRQLTPCRGNQLSSLSKGWGYSEGHAG